jgi:hypothetical protein
VQGRRFGRPGNNGGVPLVGAPRVVFSGLDEQRLQGVRAHLAGLRQREPWSAKIFFQSSFMLTTVQPFAFASVSPWSSLPTCDSRS